MAEVRTLYLNRISVKKCGKSMHSEMYLDTDFFFSLVCNTCFDKLTLIRLLVEALIDERGQNKSVLSPVHQRHHLYFVTLNLQRHKKINK